MQASLASNVVSLIPRGQVKRVSKAKAVARSNFLGNGVTGLSTKARFTPAARLQVRAANDDVAQAQQVITPLNGDPFIGMLETPVTSAPVVSNFLSQLPAYRTGVSPTSRGVEIGLAHGFLLVGPFIKLGPLRASESADLIGCLSAGGLVLILTLCLTIYGAATFQTDSSAVGSKTLTGRDLAADQLQTSEGWSGFSAGWLVGGLSGVAWAYLLTQTMPYYS